MDKRLLHIAGVLLLVVLLRCGWAVESPIGSGTVPPSGISSGLIRSPSPIDYSSNLIVTGNVRGGKHFRGIVPYRATSSFGAVTGSSLLDSFLRDSAGSERLDRYSQELEAYYSPSATVTTTRSGLPFVFRPPGTGIDGRAGRDSAEWGLLEERAFSRVDTGAERPADSIGSHFAGVALLERYRRMELAQKDTMGLESFPSIRFRPMSTTREEMERAISAEVRKYMEDRQLVGEQREAEIEGTSKALEEAREGSPFGEASALKDEQRRQAGERGGVRPELERWRREPKQAAMRVPELEMSKPVPGEASWPPTTEAARANVEELFELSRPGGGVDEKTGFDARKPVKEQVYGSGLPPGEVDRRVFGTSAGDRIWGQRQEQNEILEGLPRQDGEIGSGHRLLEAQGLFGDERELGRGSLGEKSSVLDDLSDTELSARARAILGKHKTLSSFSEDKFNGHIRAAEGYLKQGRYYRAADAYTLASIYKPKDALAYVGKSHALFAAGEYMSSALFLARALELFPGLAFCNETVEPGEGSGGGEAKKLQDKVWAECGRFKVDLESLVGGRDRLESRIVDAEQWQRRSGSGELQFLLSYVHYQMGRLERSKEAIDGASEKMPESSAVIALKKAIEDVMKK